MIPMNQILEVLSKFESKAIQDIELDRAVDADNYATVGRLIQVRNIRKAIGLAIGKPVKQCRRDLDEILKPGKLFP
jgi:transcription initiation factor IIE alpha subunit